MQELSEEAKRDLARCLGPTFRLFLSDKVPGVYMAGVSLLKMMAGSGILPARECSAFVAEITPALIDKVTPIRLLSLPEGDLSHYKSAYTVHILQAHMLHPAICCKTISCRLGRITQGVQSATMETLLPPARIFHPATC
jgi:hypothetical protein